MAALCLVLTGIERDSREVFRRTVDWAVEAGITTATFHILTPYPGTSLFSDMKSLRDTSSISLHACRLQN